MSFRIALVLIDWAPFEVIIAGISMTASSEKPGTAPLLSVFTMWVVPASVWISAISSAAESE